MRFARIYFRVLSFYKTSAECSSNIAQTVGIVVKNRMRESWRLIPRRKAISFPIGAPGFLLLFPGPRLIPDGGEGEGGRLGWFRGSSFPFFLRPGVQADRCKGKS